MGPEREKISEREKYLLGVPCGAAGVTGPFLLLWPLRFHKKFNLLYLKINIKYLYLSVVLLSSAAFW